MRIPILIEPIEGGRFRARAGEPLAACVDGDSMQDAAELLKTELQQRVRAGAVLSFVDVSNGTAGCQHDERVAATADDDWFFTELREAINENRRREDEEEQRRSTDGEKGA